VELGGCAEVRFVDEPEYAQVKAYGLAAFHVVTRGGHCWLKVEGDSEARQLRNGDLVILPPGNTHWLRDDPDSPALWLEGLLAVHLVDAELRLGGGGDGAATDLLCGAFAIEASRQHQIFSALPAAIHIRGADERALP
jgi:hypothetical protein